MAKEKVRVSLADGKYVFTIAENYEVSATRHGQPWIGPDEKLPMAGKAMWCLLTRLADLEKIAAAAVELEFILRKPDLTTIDSFTVQPLQIALREAEIPLTPDPEDPSGDEP